MNADGNVVLEETLRNVSVDDEDSTYLPTVLDQGSNLVRVQGAMTTVRPDVVSSTSPQGDNGDGSDGSNVTDIAALARAAAEAGADALSVANTWTGMAIDLETHRSRLGQPTGGLSGPAIKPLALRMVWEVARAVRVPVIGLGGIATGADALEFLVAGARAVQVGTANFVQPSAAVRILEEVENYCRKNRIAKVTELCGTLKTETEKRS